MLKSDFLDFPRYSGYSIQVKWANVQANDAKFPQDLTYQKSLKSVNFWQSYLKNEKGDVFLGHSVYTTIPLEVTVRDYSDRRQTVLSDRKTNLKEHV